MGWACGYQADLQNSYKWCSFLNRLTLHWGHHFHQARKSVSFHVPQEVHCTCAPHGSIPGPVHKMSVSVELYGQLLQLDLNQHPKQRRDRAVFTWLSKGIGFGFGFTTPFGWLVYLLWFWFYDSQVKTALTYKMIDNVQSIIKLVITWFKEKQ